MYDDIYLSVLASASFDKPSCDRSSVVKFRRQGIKSFTANSQWQEPFRLIRFKALSKLSGSLNSGKLIADTTTSETGTIVTRTRAVVRFLATQTKKSDFVSVLVGGGWHRPSLTLLRSGFLIGGHDRDSCCRGFLSDQPSLL
jgi:hypothetical protein